MEWELYIRIQDEKLEKKCFHNVSRQFCLRDHVKILAVTIHFCCSACMSPTLDAFSEKIEPILPNQIQIVMDQCLNLLQQ